MLSCTCSGIFDGKLLGGSLEVFHVQACHLNQFILGIRKLIYEILLIVCVVFRGSDIQIRELNVLELACQISVGIAALDGVVDHHESEQRIAVVAAGLTCYGVVLVCQSVAEVRKEVSGYDVDVSALAGFDYCSDRALERVSAAACGDDRVEGSVCCHQSVSSLCAAFCGGACVLGLGKSNLVIGMRGVPFFYAGLVAFPSAKPCSVALLPADQTDVPVTLFDQDVDQVLAVLGLVLMNRADEVLGICSCLLDLGAGFFADDT